MLLLNENDLRSVLNYKNVLEALESGFVGYKRKGKFPLRINIESEENNSNVLFMPSSFLDYSGVKIVSLCENNPSIGLPYTRGIFVLTSLKDGKPLCVMDGTYLTYLRTATTSLLASKYLSNKNPNSLGIIGTGKIGTMSIEAHLSYYEIDIIYAFDKLEKSLDTFIQKFGEDNSIQIISCKDGNQVVSNSDIVITATTSTFPVFNSRSVNEGTHINGIGAYRKNMQEIPEGLIIRSKIFVDTLEGAISEPGDIVIPLENGLVSKEDITEISDVILKGFSRKESDITFFKSVGFSLEDIVTAELAYREATKNGIGFEVDM
ncbi:MAG: Alanine dehydrogenase [Candidatus Methanofastidiosum methylothiophilum]|uniref:Alanine dehydrogenase n=1 Tax=Candidatus Methanofastidiosum methylothiophilum TaxID=1705564 RepID=A0A150J2W8_9EURY|nr:MAG: Alanine dehydrogenase [Candidatus Methanofastidiosum methylthiophilus]NMC76470.1 ornithine cyclodeaminase family protein [Candidatus Methanofastidiosa archaeon]